MNQKTKDILRWVVILPAVCITWMLAVFLCIEITALIEGPAFIINGISVLGFWGFEAAMFILPSIAMFFMAKWVAPKYKNRAGIIAFVSGFLWYLYMFLSMSGI